MSTSTTTTGLVVHAPAAAPEQAPPSPSSDGGDSSKDFLSEVVEQARAAVVAELVSKNSEAAAAGRMNAVVETEPRRHERFKLKLEVDFEDSEDDYEDDHDDDIVEPSAAAATKSGAAWKRRPLAKRLGTVTEADVHDSVSDAYWTSAFCLMDGRFFGFFSGHP